MILSGDQCGVEGMEGYLSPKNFQLTGNRPHSFGPFCAGPWRTCSQRQVIGTTSQNRPSRAIIQAESESSRKGGECVPGSGLGTGPGGRCWTPSDGVSVV